ncbi:MAG: AMP-binding protein [Clostridium sp.]
MFLENKSLVDLFRINDFNDQKGITYIYGDKNEKFVSYKELYKKARKILGLLQSLNIEKGNEIVMQIEDISLYISVFWACLMGGIIPIPLSVGNNDSHRLKIYKIWSCMKKPHLVTDAKTLKRLHDYSIANDMVNEYDNISKKVIFIDDLNNSEIDGEIIQSEPDDIAFVQFSSGSTGNPKGVVLTHKNLLTNLDGIATSSNMDKNDSFLSWMPLTHDMGLIGFHILPTMLNVNQYIIPTTTFVRRPTLWLKKVNQYRATITSSPNFGYQFFLNHFTEDKADNWDFSCLKHIFNGAEPISFELCDKFLNLMSKYNLKREVMYTVYGLAEATVAVAFPENEKEFQHIYVNRYYLGINNKVRIVDKNNIDAVTLVIEGYPIKYCKVKVCDDNYRIVDDMIVGHVFISGDNVTKGFYNNKIATQKVIKNDGWLDTGDLGFIKDGQIVITGREKDIIFVNGQNLYPYDLEKVAEEIEEIEVGKIAICGVENNEKGSEDVIAFVYYKKKLSSFVEIKNNIKEIIFERFGVVVKEVIPIKAMPKTTSGKIQRYKLAEDYKNGLYNEQLIELHNNELALEKNKENDDSLSKVQLILLDIFKTCMNNKEIKIDDNFFDYGGNSLILTRAYEEINDKFPGKVVLSNLFSYPTIRKLADYIEHYKQINIKSNILPSDYFVTHRKSYLHKEFSFQLNDCDLKNLENMSSNLSASKYDILSAILLVFISKINQSDTVYLYKQLDKKDEILPIEINMKDVKKFNTVINEIKNNSQNTFVSETLSIANVCKVLNGFSLLVTNNMSNEFKNMYLHIFDVVVELRQDLDEIKVLVHFNNGKINDKSMLDFTEKYAAMIEIILQSSL